MPGIKRKDVAAITEPATAPEVEVKPEPGRPSFGECEGDRADRELREHQEAVRKRTAAK